MLKLTTALARGLKKLDSGLILKIIDANLARMLRLERIGEAKAERST